MKKKYRKIKVGGETYGWTRYGAGKEHYIDVWQDKKVIFSFMLRTSEVTPRMIAEAIEEYREKQHLIFEG